MSIRAHFARTPAPAELDSICTALRADYGLRVSIIADGPEVQKAAAASASVSSAPSGGSGKVLMGHSIKNLRRRWASLIRTQAVSLSRAMF